MKTEGEILKILIRANFKSVEDASEKIGISRRTLYNYFNQGKLDLNFISLLKEKTGIDFNAQSGQNEQNEYIPLNAGRHSNAHSLGEEAGTYERNGNQFIQLDKGLYKLKTKIVTQKARAGYLTGWGDNEFIEDLPEHEITTDTPVSGEYMSFEVAGDSMDDNTRGSIGNGDIVTGRRLGRHHWKNKLHLNTFQDYVIVCNPTINNEGGILVKRIIEHNVKEGYIVCHSLNPDKKIYPDFRINMIEIMQIYNIVQVTIKL